MTWVLLFVTNKQKKNETEIHLVLLSEIQAVTTKHILFNKHCTS
jgi:hypothetical protein